MGHPVLCLRTRTLAYLKRIFAFFSDGVHGEFGPGIAHDGDVVREEFLLVEHPQRGVDPLLGEVSRCAKHHKNIGGVFVIFVVFDPDLLEGRHDFEALLVSKS